jgi:hypothetical protein
MAVASGRKTGSCFLVSYLCPRSFTQRAIEGRWRFCCAEQVRVRPGCVTSFDLRPKLNLHRALGRTISPQPQDPGASEKLDPTVGTHSCGIPPNFFRHSAPVLNFSKTFTMPHAPAKRQKREEYKNSLHTDEQNAALPKKKFYRQRAHANPFSDHSLT